MLGSERTYFSNSGTWMEWTWTSIAEEFAKISKVINIFYEFV